MKTMNNDVGAKSRILEARQHLKQLKGDIPRQESADNGQGSDQSAGHAPTLEGVNDLFDQFFKS